MLYYVNFIYSRFQVTFQSAVAKFVLNIPNYITKFGILRELNTEVPYLSTEVPYLSTEVPYLSTEVQN